ncbi:hypothetical protein DMN91_001479 [Ooceraea biroi]|uniref:Semaphorin-1A n=1 Tax=Ooceraea biroi TaxID=2015173 RepID=A0A3L8DYM6_OOCBI|nr:hypothetical protein DMN91_001479 [Ooceraea biroi]
MDSAVRVNLVHNLSLTDLTEQQRLTWYSTENDVKMCVVKGTPEENCQNYIRILVKTGSSNLFVCATNAFKPMCRDYMVHAGNYSMMKEKGGQARCPYDPQHNSTFVYVDAPNFVSSMSQGDFVYFFFRETAVEYMNCGKAVYSRVARVCKYDRGGPHRFRNRWTSFLKSRLNCSVTGDFPFYFNEIQSTTELISGQYGGTSAQLIYGTFTTPVNSISGSAVCAFSLQDIADTFAGNFKEQSAMNSNWLPVQDTKVPDPRPGQCTNDSRTLPDLTLNFINTHSLMDESVPSFFGQPIVIRTSFHYRFTQIAVDPQVKTPGGKTYDVLFIGTDNGKVIKAVNAESADSHQKVSPVVIEEIQAFPPTVPVRGIKVIRASQAGDGLEDGRLVVIADSQVQALRLHRCYSDRILSCGECVALQDPYCAWDKVEGKCRALVGPAATDASRFLQSVATGMHASCPPSKSLNKDASSVGAISANQNKFPPDSMIPNKESQGGEIINIMQEVEQANSGPEVSAADTPPPQYSVETLVMAVVAGALAALFVGFVAGYLCGRKCRKDEDDNLPYPDTEYEYFEQRQNVNSRLAPEPKLLPQEEVTYAEPVLVPQPPKLQSPKGTMRKPPPTPTETLFQFPDGYGFRGGPRGDNFGTLRSHQGDAYRRNDGFATTRSVKKVYL